MALRLVELYAQFSTKGLGKITGQLKTLHGRLSRANKGLEGMARLAKRAFMVSAGVLALTVRAAAKFEEQLAMVSTMLSKESMPIMTQYSDGLRKLAIQFGESTGTLSKGLYDILSASIAPTQALNVLAVSSKAAAAGFTSTAVSADAITTIINSYGMSADNAAEISDKLFATVKRGKLTFAELASSIGKAAATSAIAGLSLNELLAAISTITRAGIRADMAMVSVVGVIRSFLKPADDSQALARKLGFELSTATLKAKGLSGVLKDLNGLTAEQLAILFPNIRGLRGVAAAMKDLTGHTIDLNLATNAWGLTEEAMAKRRKTLSHQLRQLKERFFDLVRTIGKSLMPQVKGLVKWLKKLGERIGSMSQQQFRSIANTIKWTAAISAAVIALKALFVALVAITAHPLIALATLAAAAVVGLLLLVREVIKAAIGAHDLSEGLSRVNEEMEIMAKISGKSVEKRLESINKEEAKLLKRQKEIHRELKEYWAAREPVPAKKQWARMTAANIKRITGTDEWREELKKGRKKITYPGSIEMAKVSAQIIALRREREKLLQPTIEEPGAAPGAPKVSPLQKWWEANKSMYEKVQQLRVELTMEGIDKELALLDMRYRKEYEIVKKNKQDEKLLLEKYELDKARITQKHAKKQQKEYEERQKQQRGLRLGVVRQLETQLTSLYGTETERRVLKATHYIEDMFARLGPQLFEELRPWIEQVAEGMAVAPGGRGQRAAQWEGLGEIWRRLQAGAISPEQRVQRDILTANERTAEATEQMARQGRVSGPATLAP